MGWPGSPYYYTPKDYDGPEDKRAGSAYDVQEAKRLIDDYYAERTHYRVVNIDRRSFMITKFTFWDEAVKFCNEFGIDLMNIETYVMGERINFDTP